MKLACFCLSVVASALTASAQGVIYSNFKAGNQYSTTFEPLAAGAQLAMPFTVPPGVSYLATSVEFAARATANTTTVVLSFVSGGATPALGTAVGALPAVTLTTATAIHTSLTLLAFGPGSYWCVATNTGSEEARWMRNSAGVTDSIQRLTGGVWVTQVAADLPTLRIKGSHSGLGFFTPKPAYGSFTAPASGGRAEILLEVLCPGNPPTNPFTMPVGADIPANATPAEVCQLLAAAINDCGCSCWGTGCPSTAPYGFHADCMGSTLRVTNSTMMSCLGPSICIDHVDFVTQYAGMMEASGVGGVLRLELSGVASGIPIDATASNTFTVTRLLRCGAGSTLQPITATVALVAGMGPQQILNAVANSLTLQGDNLFTVTGTQMSFNGACGPTPDYDIAFRSNDTGLSYAYSPPFAYSMFSYIQQGVPSSVVYAGTGSPTNFGTPTIAAAGGLPVIGNAGFRFDAGSLTPIAITLLALDTNTLLPGLPVPGAPPTLSLYVFPTVLSTVVGAFGSASFPLPIPLSPTLLSAVLSAQFFDLDLTLGFALPLGSSRGCQITIGNM